MEHHMRTHIIVPDELIAAVDARVGQRRRSRFIAEAIAEKLRHADLLEAFDEFAGSLADVDIPGWETPESTSAWVRAMREDPAALVQSLRDAEPSAERVGSTDAV
jgi:hypothetical protein